MACAHTLTLAQPPLARWDGVSVVAKSPQKSCDLAELAIPLVRKLVGARRRYGLSWDQSLADVAPELGISPWRAHTLYYRLAGIRPVLLAEWNRLRLRGAAMLRAGGNAPSSSGRRVGRRGRLS